MEKEWRLFLKDNAPELYKQMQGSVSWAAEWRDKKITELTTELEGMKITVNAENDRLERNRTLELANKQLLDALNGLYQHTKNNYNICGLNQAAKELLTKESEVPIIMNTRFDLEGAIMTAWGTKEEIELLFRHVMECETLDRDYLANALLGVATMHDIKSRELFDLFEQMVRNENIS